MVEGYVPEKTDSIKVTKTSTGKHTFEMKIYSKDLTDEKNQDEVISKLNKIETKLKQTFGEF